MEGLCVIGREPKRIKGQNYTSLHSFSPHTLPTLFPICPQRLSRSWREWCMEARWPCLSPSALSTPHWTLWLKTNNPNYHCYFQLEVRYSLIDREFLAKEQKRSQWEQGKEVFAELGLWEMETGGLEMGVGGEWDTSLSIVSILFQNKCHLYTRD